MSAAIFTLLHTPSYRPQGLYYRLRQKTESLDSKFGDADTRYLAN
jgi:hypothetical protein